MCRMQCYIILITVLIGVVNSWDIAITYGNQLQFYTNGEKTSTKTQQFGELTALAYDAVYNMMFFIDKYHTDNTSIFSYNLDTEKFQPLVKSRGGDDIQGIAFDPVESKLFWTDTKARSIFWMSLKPGAQNNLNGNLLLKLGDDELPRAIAVDSCRGYIYWTNVNPRPTIERAKHDGSDREVVVKTELVYPVSLAIDQHTQTLYWIDDTEGIHFQIEKIDLDDTKNRKIVLEYHQHQPYYLTVSQNSLYWIDWDLYSVWQLPKYSNPVGEPKEVFTFANSSPFPFGIAANYTIKDQIAGAKMCKTLERSIDLKTATNAMLPCNCTPGCMDKCELSVCQNFCLHGDCSLTVDGNPTCRCRSGFIGPRCEVNLCHSFCLNDAHCTIDHDKQIPVCKCDADFEGSRCEIRRKLVISSVEPLNKTCNCTSQENITATTPIPTVETLRSSDSIFVENNSSGWDPVRDPILMVMGIFSGLLCVTCAFLIAKIINLKKRPRIKKRIIVNKNVTPLTARPDQCEITIENCCNMNICETPCFEPRATIRPTLLDCKPGKEEKRNLINNMEHHDDF